MAGRYFEYLPVELLQQICAQFCPHCRTGPDFTRIQFAPDPGPTLEGDTELFNDQSRQDRSDLARLCRVSRTLKAIATPYLYHCIPVFAERSYNGLPPERTHALLDFSRTIRSRPELASHIKYLDLPLHFAFSHGSRGYRLRQWPRWHHKFNEKLSILAARLRTDPLNNETLRHLHDFILQNAPSIQVINVATPDNPVPPRQKYTYALNSLTTLRARCHNSCRPLDPDPDTHHLLTAIANRAPNLRSLHLEQVSLFHFVPDALTSVTSLHLRLSQRLDTWGILELISRCGPLHAFHVDVLYGSAEPYDGPYVSLATLAGVNQVLSHLRSHHHHQKMLRSLAVQFRMDGDPLDGLGNDSGGGGAGFEDISFASYTNLTHLVVHLSLYRQDKRLIESPSLLVDILPPSIRRVELYRTGWEWAAYEAHEGFLVKQLGELREAVDKGRFPELKWGEVVVMMEDEELVCGPQV